MPHDRLLLHGHGTLVQTLGLIAGGTLIALLTFMGAMMLISPRLWFDLPPYLGFQGSIRRKQIESRWGRFEIRLGGLFMILGIGSLWVPIAAEALALPLGNVQNWFLRSWAVMSSLGMAVFCIRAILKPGDSQIAAPLLRQKRAAGSALSDPGRNVPTLRDAP